MSPWNSSYIYGNDDTNGWGKRYFFTYFTEFGHRPVHNVAIEISIFAIIFLASVLANISIMICVIKFPEMKTVTNYFVLNLAVADLLFAITIPAVAYARAVASWRLGNLACKLIPYIQFVSGIVLLWTLAFISMDRHRCIVVPPYRSRMTPRQSAIFSAITWLLSMAVFLPVLFWFQEIALIADRDQKACTLIFPKSGSVHFSALFVVPVVGLACLLPMGMLVYYYQTIFRKIISTRNTWASSCVMMSSEESTGGDCHRNQTRRQSELSISDIFVPWPRKFSLGTCATSPTGESGRPNSLSHHEELRLNKHVKVVRVLFLNVVVVLLMWLPITLVMGLIYIDGSRSNADRDFFLRSHHFIAALTVAFLNTLVNPLLYGVLSNSFRPCLKRLWCGRRVVVRCEDVSNRDRVTVSSGGGQNRELVTKNGFRQTFINSVSG